MKLKYGKLLSNVTFNCNLRHYAMAFSGLGFLSIYITARLRVFAAPDPAQASVWRMAVSWWGGAGCL